MDKGEKYNIDTDPDFDVNFYKNIEKVLSDAYLEDTNDNWNKETADSPKAYTFTEDNKQPVDDQIMMDGEFSADVNEACKNSTADQTSEISELSATNQDEEDSELLEDDQIMADTELPFVGAVMMDEEILVTDELLGNEGMEEAEQGDSAAIHDSVSSDMEEEIIHKVDDALIDINASLAKQISEELGLLERSTVKKKMPKSRKALSVALIVLACLVGLGSFLGFTKPGNKLLMRMGVDISGKIWATMTKDFEKEPEIVEDTDHLDESDLETDEEDIDTNLIQWPEHPGYGRQEEGVYNILLLGEEAIDSGTARGRTDVIIIATMNTNTKELKLTSLMRDTLVRIPGYQENKLNTAYEKGGVDLLYETIAVNYDIRLDGCIMVNFEKFEKIIDKLGGVEITLTASEAKYLNRTNYISKPQYRTVVEGKQLMNGNQVLGYTRIRKRANINGVNNDYGRTERHRIVLDAIFEKYKTKSKLELGSMMFSFLPMITTDISSKTFEMLLNNFIEMGTTKIDQLRLPADGTFTDNVEVRGMDVLIPDWDKNITLLHDFVFGDDKAAAQ